MAGLRLFLFCFNDIHAILFFSIFCGWQNATTTIMKLFFDITALSDPLDSKREMKLTQFEKVLDELFVNLKIPRPSHRVQI